MSDNQLMGTQGILVRFVYWAYKRRQCAKSSLYEKLHERDL